MASGAEGAQRHLPYVAGLDLIRFFAALSVMSYHLGLGSWAGADQTLARVASYPELVPFVWVGWLGVEAFFILSGFVIAFSSEGVSLRAFVHRRALRLYPAAIVCATLTLAVAVCFKHMRPSYLAKAWLFSATLFPFTLTKIDSPYWTLNIEVVFYGLIAASILARLRSRAMWLLLAMAVASSAYNIGSCFLFRDFAMARMWDIRLELSLLQYGCCFALGGAIWRGATLGFGKVLSCTALIAFAGCCAEVYLKAIFNIHAFDPGGNPWLPVGLLALFVVSILGSVVLNPWVSPLMRGWGRRLGLATYPLYLVHNLVGRVFMEEAVPIIGRWPALMGASLLCICLAFLVLPIERRIAHCLDVIARRRFPGFGPVLASSEERRPSWWPISPFRSRSPRAGA